MVFDPQDIVDAINNNVPQWRIVGSYNMGVGPVMDLPQRQERILAAGAQQIGLFDLDKTEWGIFPSVNSDQVTYTLYTEFQTVGYIDAKDLPQSPKLPPAQVRGGRVSTHAVKQSDSKVAIWINIITDGLNSLGEVIDGGKISIDDLTTMALGWGQAIADAAAEAEQVSSSPAEEPQSFQPLEGYEPNDLCEYCNAFPSMMGGLNHEQGCPNKTASVHWARRVVRARKLHAIKRSVAW